MNNKPNAAVLAQRMEDFANRADIRNLAVLFAGGLINPFDLVERITDLAMDAGIDAPVRLN